MFRETIQKMRCLEKQSRLEDISRDRAYQDIESFFSELLGRFLDKGKTYALDGKAFTSILQGSKLSGGNPVEETWGYLRKHIITLQTICEKGVDKAWNLTIKKEQYKETLGDIALYCGILYSILKNLGEEK